jgi:hypothetical protein
MRLTQAYPTLKVHTEAELDNAAAGIVRVRKIAVSAGSLAVFVYQLEVSLKIAV